MIDYKNIKKVLIIRTDRIGDCVLSTPVIEAIYKLIPNVKIDILTTKYTYEIFEGNPYVNKVFIDNKDYSIFSFKYFDLIKTLKAEKYDVCFILHLTFRDALTAFLANIKFRISPATKIYQFLSTNRILQKRSQCLMNEAEYNLDLIKQFLNLNLEVPKPTLYFNEKDKEFAKRYLDTMLQKYYNITYNELKKSNKKLIMIHPGCGGSALNMSVEKYINLFEKLNEQNYIIFLSTGPNELQIKNNILKILSYTPLHYTNENINLKQVFTIISECDLIIAPSTGIMHIASALDVPLVTLFCPIYVCQPKRWGPFKAKNAEVLMPNVICNVKSNILNEKYCKKCIKNKCKFYNCMDKIQIEDIIAKIKSLLN